MNLSWKTKSNYNKKRLSVKNWLLGGHSGEIFITDVAKPFLLKCLAGCSWFESPMLHLNTNLCIRLVFLYIKFDYNIL